MVWSEPMQELSSSMSDGEVESLIFSCDSAEQLRLVVEWLFEALESDKRSPFSILQDTAAASGMAVSEWIRASLGSPGKEA